MSPISPRPRRCWRAPTASIRNSPPTMPTPSRPSPRSPGDRPSSSSGSTAWARRCTAKSCGPRASASPAASMRRSAATRSAGLSRAPAVGEWRQHLLRQPARRRRGADRRHRCRSGREGGGVAREGQSAIPIPPDLFLPERKNSLGLPLWDDLVREPLLRPNGARACRPRDCQSDRRRAERSRREARSVGSPRRMTGALWLASAAARVPRPSTRRLRAATDRQRGLGPAGRRGARRAARARRRSLRGEPRRVSWRCWCARRARRLRTRKPICAKRWIFCAITRRRRGRNSPRPGFSGPDRRGERSSPCMAAACSPASRPGISRSRSSPGRSPARSPPAMR